MNSQARLVNSAGSVLTSNLLHQRERERVAELLVCIYFNYGHYSHTSDEEVWGQHQCWLWGIMIEELGESLAKFSTVRCLSQSLSVCAGAPGGWELVHWKLPGGETREGRGSLFRGLTWSPRLCNNPQYRNVLCSQIFSTLLQLVINKYFISSRNFQLQHGRSLNPWVFSWLETRNQLTNVGAMSYSYRDF